MAEKEPLHVYAVSGEIRIPLEDLAQWILNHISAADLAEGLLRDEDMRTLLIEGLAQRYNVIAIEDEHRRDFLQQVKTVIHSQALDKLVDSLSTLEYAARNKAHYYYQRHTFNLWWNAVKDTMQRCEGGAEVLAAVEAGHGQAFKEAFDKNDPEFFISGKHWNEARDFWRKQAVEWFPFPEKEPEDRTNEIPF